MLPLDLLDSSPKHPLATATSIAVRMKESGNDAAAASAELFENMRTPASGAANEVGADLGKEKFWDDVVKGAGRNGDCGQEGKDRKHCYCGGE